MNDESGDMEPPSKRTKTLGSVQKVPNYCFELSLSILLGSQFQTVSCSSQLTSSGVYFVVALLGPETIGQGTFER